MKNTNKPISALLVGAVSAAVYGGVALLCGPPVLFFLTIGSSPGLGADPVEGWATAAVLAPLASSAIGFVLGWFMASMYNLFVRQVFAARPGMVAIRRVSRPTYAAQPRITGGSSHPGNPAGVEGRVIAS